MARYVVFTLVVTMLVLETLCCGFGLGGGECGGGGGGCGGGCSSGCGRKKREIIEPQIRTEQHVLCPQNEWRVTMEQNMGKDIETTKYAIQGALYKKYDNKFYVACQPSSQLPQMQFVANGEGYCGHSNGDFFCNAIALVG
uniref:Ground-like domain-containing protein n=1 Tax=Panagrellus redivivus TaxID=6233 RepID=A0A7E4VKR7_PANRE